MNYKSRLTDFLENMHKVKELLSDDDQEEFAYILFYYNFMTSFLSLLKKYYSTYFQGQNEINMINIWIIFVYLKKIILKRKNEYYQCLYLLGVIFEEIKILLNKTNTCININFKEFLKDACSFQLSKYDEEKFDSLSWIVSQIDNKIFDIINENIETVLSLYRDVEIDGELDDYLIFQNYFVNIRLKKVENLKFHNKSNFLNTSLDLSILNSRESFQTNTNPQFETFFLELNDFNYLDLFYLQIVEYFVDDQDFLDNKFKLLISEQNDYNVLFVNFKNSFLSPYINKICDKFEHNQIYHKIFFLKLAESMILTMNKNNKFCLCHESLLIISFWIILNFLYVETKPLIDKLNSTYFDNINRYTNFKFLKVSQHLNLLLKCDLLPLNVVKLLKTFQNSLINYVMWQENSFFFSQREEIDKSTLKVSIL
jgi:hypothetical protein